MNHVEIPEEKKRKEAMAEKYQKTQEKIFKAYIPADKNDDNELQIKIKELQNKIILMYKSVQKRDLRITELEKQTNGETKEVQDILDIIKKDQSKGSKILSAMTNSQKVKRIKALQNKLKDSESLIETLRDEIASIKKINSM